MSFVDTDKNILKYNIVNVLLYYDKRRDWIKKTSEPKKKYVWKALI